MILAGADRLQAVRPQVVAVFMLLVLAAVSLTATLISRPPAATRYPVRYGIRNEQAAAVEGLSAPPQIVATSTLVTLPCWADGCYRRSNDPRPCQDLSDELT